MKPALDYERPRKRLRPPLWLLIVCTIVVSGALWFTNGYDPQDRIFILMGIVALLGIFATIVLGVRYGDDGKPFRGQ